MPDAVADAVSSYARRLHAAIGDRHHVASPLGAWLVLALIGDDELSDVLGMPAADAARAARALLDEPHPAVRAAAAVWTAVPPAGPAAEWVDGLPSPVARGPLPTQEEADAWAREQTSGLVERFPIELDQPWACVLTSALATRITWLAPFTTAAAAEFRSPWRDRLTTVLVSPRQGHDGAIVRHRIGDLAVHRAHGDDLTVTSVIAPSHVPASDVLDAAHDVVRGRVERRSLFDLPLGDGPSWTVGESDGAAGAEQVTSVLPAWSARSDHDLRPPDLGFAQAAGTLARLFGGGGPWSAAQAAAARYDRRGFEAAAVTALAVALSARAPGRQRNARLWFDRPHAVVATAADHSSGPWRGLPVFSAWVAEPEDATER